MQVARMVFLGRSRLDLGGGHWVGVLSMESCTLHCQPLHFAYQARARSNLRRVAPAHPGPFIARSTSPRRWLLEGYLYSFRRWLLRAECALPAIAEHPWHVPS